MLNLVRVTAISLFIIAFVVACSKSGSGRQVIGGVAPGNAFSDDAETDGFFGSNNCIQYAQVTSGGATINQLEFYAQAPNSDYTCSQNGNGMLFSLPLQQVQGSSSQWQAFPSQGSSTPYGLMISGSTTGSSVSYTLSALCQFGQADVTTNVVYSKNCLLTLNASGNFQSAPTAAH
jgi:hypothetical protein